MKQKLIRFISKIVQTAVKTEFNEQILNLSAEKNKEFIINRYINFAVPNAINFNYDFLKNKTLSFTNSLQIDNKIGMFKYSQSTSKPNLYSSVYACLIFSLYDEIDSLTKNDRTQWATYLNSFQSENDGLYYDEALKNHLFNDSDWWGARHLALHLISALTALDSKPKFPFKFLEYFYKEENLLIWLDSNNWEGDFSHRNDIDNKVMNIGCLLQYSRDAFQDKSAGDSLSILTDYLKSKVIEKSGIWGNDNLGDPYSLSRMIQFTYHLLMIFFYDNLKLDNKETIIDLTLKTQNNYGGFGVTMNSSACEDIDSIELLTRMSRLTNYRSEEIRLAINKALVWILTNMNDDGGFVFRRNEAFQYGHDEMYSGINESSLFATWFRTLSLAYIAKYLQLENSFRVIRSPGYQFLSDCK